MALGFEFAYEADEGVVDFIALLVLRYLDEAIGVVDQVLLMDDKFAEGDGGVGNGDPFRWVAGSQANGGVECAVSYGKFDVEKGEDEDCGDSYAHPGFGISRGEQVLPERLAFLYEDEIQVGFFVAPGVEDAGCAAQFFKDLAAGRAGINVNFEAFTLVWMDVFVVEVGDYLFAGDVTVHNAPCPR